MAINVTIYFLSYSKLPLLPPAEINVVTYLRKKALTVEIINWDEFDTSLIQSCDIIFLRSTWNYDQKPAEFNQFLNQLKITKARVFNDIDLMLWNMNKSYMFEFQSKGLAVVPTFSPIQKELLIQNHPHCSKIIAKPIFSAGARGLIQFTKEEWLHNELPENQYICQPYITSVADSGEWSLLYFDGTYSHAVLKKAQKGDFRVQSDYGGTVEFVEIEDSWNQLGLEFIHACQSLPFFARVDFVLFENKPVLIELEIIEPELFVTNQQANDNYINAIYSKIEELIL